MAFLKTKDILDLTEITEEEIYKLVSLALKLKSEGKNAKRHDLSGKTAGLIFSKPSTRTRVSFEVGLGSLGASSIYLNSSDLQLNRGESFADTAKVLSSYLDAIVIRTHDHNEAAQLAKHSSIPVINALTDLSHPCQALTDLVTIYEQKNHFSDLKVAYFGDGNNVCHSLINAAAKVGVDISVATPKGFEPQIEVLNKAKKFAKGSKIEVTNNPREAVKDADVLYTDVWVSMGQEEEEKERLNTFKPYQVNELLLKEAKSDAVVMHCLPAHRGQEITANAIDGNQSVVFSQAENRLYTQKALLMGLIGESYENKV